MLIFVLGYFLESESLEMPICSSHSRNYEHCKTRESFKLSNLVLIIYLFFSCSEARNSPNISIPPLDRFCSCPLVSSLCALSFFYFFLKTLFWISYWPFFNFRIINNAPSLQGTIPSCLGTLTTLNSLYSPFLLTLNELILNLMILFKP